MTAAVPNDSVEARLARVEEQADRIEAKLATLVERLEQKEAQR